MRTRGTRGPVTNFGSPPDPGPAPTRGTASDRVAAELWIAAGLLSVLSWRLAWARLTVPTPAGVRTFRAGHGPAGLVAGVILIGLAALVLADDNKNRRRAWIRYSFGVGGVLATLAAFDLFLASWHEMWLLSNELADRVGGSADLIRGTL